MEIIVENITTYHRSIPSIDGAVSQKKSNFEDTEFAEIANVFRKVAEETKVKFEEESVEEKQVYSNNAEPDKKHGYNYGDVIGLFESIERISLIVGSFAALIRILKALVPIVEKCIEKRAGRQITIKTSEFEISVENKKDLELAIQKVKELKELENQEKKKKKGS